MDEPRVTDEGAPAPQAIPDNTQQSVPPNAPGLGRNAVVLAVVILAVTAMLVAGKYLSRQSAPTAAGGVGTAKGAIAPDFELTSLDGKPVKLSDYRGQAVLVNFWATWCGPCKIEIPWFVDLQKQYGPQGFQVIGISMDDDAGPVKKFYEEFKIDYPVAVGDDKLADKFGGILGLPVNFVIDRDGHIVKKFLGATEASVIEKEVAAQLAAR